ncbi:hypothetical protein R1flu_003741 [Riccia fluitans]|uniref:Uncharacterized protein n=1 Tax=Riccia fluitans TaxID=41844 RepID=A0ABD1YA67_9MARC
MTGWSSYCSSKAVAPPVLAWEHWRRHWAIALAEREIKPCSSDFCVHEFCVLRDRPFASAWSSRAYASQVIHSAVLSAVATFSSRRLIEA